MVYLIIANIALVIAYVLYRTIFKKLTFFSWNRAYLVSMLIFAMLVPIGLYIDLSEQALINQQLPTIDLSFMGEIEVLATNESSAVQLMDILLPVYWTGVCLSVAWFLYRMFLFSRKSKQIGDYESFSFLGKMFLGDKVRHNKVIQAHEAIHIQHGHTYDILLIELVRCLNWFNPVLFFYQRDLKFQHECIADSCCASDKKIYAELLVTHAFDLDESTLFHEFSNQSFLKKRIMMLFKNQSNKKAKLFYLAAIPALLLIVGSTLVFNTTKARSMVQTFEHQLQDTQFSLGNISHAAAQSKGTSTFLDSNEEISQYINRILTEADTIDKDVVFTEVQVPPEYPGGMDAFREYVGKNFQYPQEAIDAGIKGTLRISFIVETDGSLTNFELIDDLGYSTGEAAIALLEASPKWSPGIQNERKVRVKYLLPLAINLE